MTIATAWLDRFWRNRLQFRIGMTLILLATVILGGFGLYRYVLLRSESIAELNALADSAIERLANNLAVPLWNYDIDLVKQSVLTEMKEGNISGIVVKYTANFIDDSQEPELLAAVNRDDQWQSVFNKDPVLLHDDVMRRAEISYEGSALGFVELGVTRHFITIELSRQIRNLILQILVLDLALFAFLGFSLRRLLIKPIKELAFSANAIADGDFKQKIPIRQRDEIGRFAEAFQRMQNTIMKVFQEMEGLTRAIESGDLDCRGQAEHFDGGWRELILGVNRTVDAFVTPFKVSAEYIDHIALGAIPKRISGHYQGDFNTIRDNLNKLTHAMETTITMAEAVADGNLNVNAPERSEQDRMMRALNRMTMQLRLRTEQLQQQTAELTLAKDNALEAQKTAEVANRAKSEFLSKMSHELRTPLNGVLGYAQILSRSQNLNSSQISGLKVIRQSGEHLLTLINDILDLAKIEARRLELYPSPMKLRPFLDGVAGIMLMRAQQKGLRLLFECDPELPTRIEADETRLRQVLLNLLGNAVKFTEMGGTITLSIVNCQLTIDNSETVNLQFSISDTGVGMTEEQIATIFRPFEQVGDLQQRAAGTGLGLAISQQLVELMGGKIHVESRPGKGSSFLFALHFPVLEAQRDDGTSSRKQLIGYAGERRTALVVDDIEPNRLVLRDMLCELGFEVILAADGDEGVEQARRRRPDIIFSDLVMPRKSGFELVKELRRLPEFQHSVIIAVSASVVKTEQHRSRFVGCNAFLPKPVSSEKLSWILQEHLKLDWLYEEKAEKVREQKSGGERMMLPPRQEFDILYEQAWLGFMNEVIIKANDIETLGEKYIPFTRQVKQFAEQFEEQKLIAWLDQLVEGTRMQK